MDGESFCVSRRFLDGLNSAYLVVLAVNLVTTNVWKYEQTKLILEPKDLSTYHNGTIVIDQICAPQELPLLAITSVINVDYPQKWIWRLLVGFGSGASFFLVPLFVHSTKIIVLVYLKETALFIITYCLDLTIPVLADHTALEVWGLHLLAVAILSISNMTLVWTLDYTVYKYTLWVMSPLMITFLTISRVYCTNYFYTIFVLLEYITITTIILIHRRLMQDCIDGKLNFQSTLRIQYKSLSSQRAAYGGDVSSSQHNGDFRTTVPLEAMPLRHRSRSSVHASNENSSSSK